ncbi:MAG: ABC transporter permease [Candidatus Bathyarchaeia archaeon]
MEVAEFILSEAFMTSLAVATVRMAVPLLYVGMGELFAERSGVLNLGVEGIIQVGALAAFVAVFMTGDLWIGVLAGLGVGAVFGIIHAVTTVTIRTDQVVTGIAVWILGWGLASYLFRVTFPGFARVNIPLIDKINIPLLQDIPILGPALFQNNIMVYIAFLLVPASAIVLFRTTIGLKIRTVGENPRVADTLGVNVYRVRYMCIIYGAILAALAGVYFSIAQMGMFVDNVSAGRGWIAIVVVMFGRWNPYRALLGALLFGGVDALQLRFQALGIGTATGLGFQFLVMLPYLLTVIVLILVAKRAGLPGAFTVPYVRGER